MIGCLRARVGSSVVFQRRYAGCNFFRLLSTDTVKPSKKQGSVSDAVPPATASAVGADATATKTAEETKRRKPRTTGQRNKDVADVKGITYTPAEALVVARKHAKAKFDESITMAVKLRLDVRKADQMIRTSVSLPHGSGKKSVVAVVAEGDLADQVLAAGADIVGVDNLIADITAGKFNFTTCIASPSMMPKLKSVARILGPKGLMPNAKVGTLTEDVVEAVKKAKRGSVNIRTDKFGILHAPVGKISYTDEQLLANIKAFLMAVRENRPSGSRGKYIEGIHLSSSMGPGVELDLAYADSTSARFMQPSKMEV